MGVFLNQAKPAKIIFRKTIGFVDMTELGTSIKGMEDVYAYNVGATGTMADDTF